MSDLSVSSCLFFFFQAEDGIRDDLVTGVQTCALPIYERRTIIDRQTVSIPGRYRFNNISLGWFDVAVEAEGQEIYRVRVDLTSPLIGDQIGRASCRERV